MSLQDLLNTPIGRRLREHAAAVQEGQLRVGLPGLGSREVQVGDVPVVMTPITT